MLLQSTKPVQKLFSIANSANLQQFEIEKAFSIDVYPVWNLNECIDT